MIDTLLTTKLFLPAARPNAICRPRLIERLNAGRDAGHRLTLISAPAGYGKTTLLAEWIATKPECAAWLSLDAQDDNAARFWTYVIAALQTVSKADLGQRALQALEASEVSDPQTILTSLLNDVAALDHTIILVLDDYHVITNRVIHEGMTFLIEHLPQQLHLVIATRADPLLPISRLRARGQLTELRVADLRFTADEAAAFLNDSMNLDLTAQDVQALESRTEGWIVGLQLAALSMQGRADAHAFIEAFTGSHHYVLEYLADEVLQRQPESLQRFLIETSILNRMCAPLCNAVTERSDSADVLADLNRRNLFVTPLDGEHYWFRYHHLFAELLNGHLQRLRANDLPMLHRRAAQWHEANGDAGDALRHALAIPDYAYASRMVVNNWRRIYHQGHLRMAVEWLNSLPADLIRQSPPLSVAYCWTLFVRGDYDRIAPYLDEITIAFERLVASGALPKTHPEYNIVMQQVGLLRAVVARHHGDLTTAIREVEQILPIVPGFRQTLGQVVVDMGYTACYSQMGYNYLAAGDLDQAADYLSRISPHARACGNIFALAHTTFELARLRLRQGRLSEAEAICREELTLAGQPAYADFPAFCLIHLALADVLREQKRYDEAAAYLQRGLETAQRSGHVLYWAHGYLIAARLHHAQGDASAAQADCHRAEQLAATISNPALNQAIAQVKQEIESAPLSSAQSLIEPLSERELQVLRLICEGKSNQEIADELVIALDTVKRHANNLYGKLGVKRRAQAIIQARKLGI